MEPVAAHSRHMQIQVVPITLQVRDGPGRAACTSRGEGREPGT